MYKKELLKGTAWTASVLSRYVVLYDATGCSESSRYDCLRSVWLLIHNVLFIFPKALRNKRQPCIIPLVKRTTYPFVTNFLLERWERAREYPLTTIHRTDSIGMPFYELWTLNGISYVGIPGSIILEIITLETKYTRSHLFHA